MTDKISDDVTMNKMFKNKVRYAGFGIRLGAALIDLLVLLPIIVLNFYNILNVKSLSIAIGLLTLSTLYKPLMEYYFQATLGKMAVSLKVVDYDFERIDATQAILRYFPWLITNVVSLMTTIFMFGDKEFMNVDNFLQYSEFANNQDMTVYTQWIGLVILISALAIFFTSKKQAIHDMVAGTYCIYKD